MNDSCLLNGMYYMFSNALNVGSSFFAQCLSSAAEAPLDRWAWINGWEEKVDWRVLHTFTVFEKS